MYALGVLDPSINELTQKRKNVEKKQKSAGKIMVKLLMADRYYIMGKSKDCQTCQNWLTNISLNHNWRHITLKFSFIIWLRTVCYTVQDLIFALEAQLDLIL